MTQSQTIPGSSAPPALMKFALKVQVFLLRRNFIKGMNKALMVITTTGRKSGKHFALPIGYVRDGSDILTFSLLRDGRRSNWYENVLVNKTATLEIQGQKIEMRGEPITDPDGLRYTLTRYKEAAPSLFERFFGFPPETPIEEQLEKIKGNVRFMRFTPVK
jgi:hypothetical protein